MRRALAVLVLCAPGGIAYAQPADVSAQIKLLETQPADMDKGAWREKRREVAKQLGKAKAKAAVPALMRVAESETFDVVGENAIEALGLIGDPQAVPLLQKIATDPDRDASQRERAKKALKKLGAKAEAPPPPPDAKTPPPDLKTPDATPPPDGKDAKTPPDAKTPDAKTPEPSEPATPAHAVPSDTGEGVLLGGGTPGAPTESPTLPAIDDDVLAASERVTFAAGDASLSYDTVRKRVDADGNIGGTYSKRVEKPTMAYGYDGSVNVVAGYIDPQGPAVSRGGEFVAAGDGELRGYHDDLYGVAKVAVSAQYEYTALVANDGTDQGKNTAFDGDAQLALGGGYGRVLDVGAAIRVRQLARALQANRALGKPIDAALARKLQLTWWSLRGERTAYRSLLATVAILREAGVLLGEPDAGVAYEILNVLRDTQLYARPVGLDLQVAFGEGYLKRPDGVAYENGRVEQLLGAASYGKELDDDKVQITGTGFARLRLFASGNPAPWAVGATLAVARYIYGEHGDPLGALDASVSLGLSNDDVMNGDAGLSVTTSLGFTDWLNQASGLRLAATATVDQGQLFLGAQFSATYGLLDGTVAR